MIDVRLTAVSKRFAKSSDSAAVDDVTVTIGAGEFFTLLGPSGCGKTTTLRMVAGFYFPTSGHIHFGDDDVTHWTPNKRDTGMVFQNYALFPHMTVAQNVAYGLKVRRVSRADQARRVEEALAQVHLAGYGDRRIDALSGGQQQRVACARALVARPEVIFADEPTGNLDSRSGAEVLKFLRNSVREHGQTIVMVTHDPTAAAYADRVVFLADGQIVSELIEPTAETVLDTMKKLDAPVEVGN